MVLCAPMTNPWLFFWQVVRGLGSICQQEKRKGCIHIKQANSNYPGLLQHLRIKLFAVLYLIFHYG